jgi:DNA-binding transcriptional ArsR family regulator
MTRAALSHLDLPMLERAAKVLRVLAHPERLQLVDLLLRRPVAVGELARLIGRPQAVVSQHLTNMRAHGIVESRRAGRHVHYYVINPNAEALLDCLRKHGDGR